MDFPLPAECWIRYLLSGSVLLRIREEFPDNIELVITGPYLPVVCLLGVVLKDVGQPLWGEYLLPEVGRLHPDGVDRVAGAAVLLTLVEGQEVRGLAFQFCAELHLFIVDREVDGAPAQPEEVLLWTSGCFVLLHGVGYGLSGEPVLEFHRDDWGGRSRTERCPGTVAGCWRCIGVAG